MKKNVLYFALTVLLTENCILPTVSCAQYTKIIDFTGTNGNTPYGDLFFDGTFLYGMTEQGGTNDQGVIFKIKPDGTGYAKLLDFAGSANGRHPLGSLISDGIFLYGMTGHGGTTDDGTIFKIKPDGTGYVKLFNFSYANRSGYRPYGDLISDGIFLYGMTGEGGASGQGAIFKIKPDGTGYTKLIDFSVATNGSGPLGDLISDGTFLYGMTDQGGTTNQGVIFKIKSDGTGYTKLIDFSGATNGSHPYGSLISDGTFLYGMTATGGTNDNGTIFKIKFNGTEYAKLLDFVDTSIGKHPASSLISDGTFLYGMTSKGGLNDMGTIFKYALVTSIAEKNSEKGLHIFPNPFNSQTTITFTQEQKNTTIKIMDMLGKDVKTVLLSGSNKLTLEKGGLKEGIYFVHITDASNNVMNRKIVVK